MAVARAARPISAQLFDVLQAQQARLPRCEARTASLGRLRSGAAAVVTGQQVGLFLGPLYSLYKAASAIRVAQALEEETGTPVVPVFWLQTEDHDLAEIASVQVPRLHGDFATLQVSFPENNRIPVAHHVLPSDVDDALEDLREIVATLPHANTHLALLRRHYRPGVPWSTAFAGVFAELFAGTGLVLVDPRDPALAPLAAPIHLRALSDASALSATLLERCRALESSGFSPPIHVREGAPLSFFHPDGVQGPRFRLAPGVRGLQEVGGEGAHTTASLLSRCEREPGLFSTSALLRPILQDTLLPTAAYVGGPGEIAYFAQLGPLYDAFAIPMPLIVPRARFRVLEPRITRTLDRLGLAPEDLTKPEEVLLARHAGASSGALSPEALEGRILSGFDAALDDARASLGADAALLGRAFEKTRGTARWAAGMLRRRYARVIAQRDSARIEDLRRVQSFVRPGGQPQERSFNISWFAARAGDAVFVQQVLEAVTPFDPAQKDLAS